MFEYNMEKAQIIVFLTDGRPTSGVSATSQIRQNIKDANTEFVSLYSLGLGSNVNFDFLSAMSLENYGFAQKIYTSSNVSLQIEDFYDRISTALLRNLKFSYSDGTYEIYPEKIDYLFEGSECVISGKFDPDMTFINSSVSAQTGNGMRYFNESFDLEDSGNYSFIPRFWAYNKINHLMDRITVEGATDELVKEIVTLSLEFHFVTEYTSLFLEINETINNDWGDTSTNYDIDNNIIYSPQIKSGAYPNGSPAVGYRLAYSSPGLGASPPAYVSSNDNSIVAIKNSGTNYDSFNVNIQGDTGSVRNSTMIGTTADCSIDNNLETQMTYQPSKDKANSETNARVYKTGLSSGNAGEYDISSETASSSVQNERILLSPTHVILLTVISLCTALGLSLFLISKKKKMNKAQEKIIALNRNTFL
jgi:hypothetical protein